jgi:hypothetical protein
MALFATPEQIAAAERARTQSVGSNFGNAVSGSLFGLGNELGNVAQRAFGADTRSQAVRDAATIQSIVKGVNFDDADSIVKAANDLNTAGFQEQAFKFLSALPPTKQPKVQGGRVFTLDQQVGDTTKRFIYQVDSDNKIRKIGEVSDTATVEGLDLPSQLLGDVDVDETEATNMIARLASRPEFSGLIDTDTEDLAPLVGQVQSVANQLKTAHRRSLIDAFGRKEIDNAGIKREMFSDNEYLRQAFGIYARGRGLETDVDTGLGIAGADVEVSGEVDASDLGTLSGNIDDNDAQQAAIASAAARAGKLVIGDPKKDEFRMGGLEPVAALDAFGRIANKTDEEIRKDLESRGFRFNNELFESHARHWQFLREAPQTVGIFLGAGDDEDFREARIAQHLEELQSTGDWRRWADAQQAVKYLRRVGSTKKEEAKKTLGTAGRITGRFR